MSKRLLAFGLGVLAAALLATSLGFPLWQLRMEAPQYRDEEALKVAVYPHSLRGDLNEIRTLNQYIGVHIPDALPQLTWLSPALLAGAVLGVIAIVLPEKLRRAVGLAVPVVLALLLAAAAVQAQAQMYDIGHKRDAKTKLVGVKDFTPPLLGRTRIAQFDVTSTLGLGAGLIAAGLSVQVASALLSAGRNSAENRTTAKRLSATDWPDAFHMTAQSSQSK
jgi:copper chaperone NosL